MSGISKTPSGNPVLRLLGGLEFDGPEAKSLPRKVKALAACVALHGSRGISRERLAALFWEDRAEDQARASLRQALSLLRRTLGDALVADDGIVRLESEIVSVDVWEFEDLIAMTDVRSLETASSLYVGDLLDGFSIREEAFEAWLRTERERLRNLMTAGLTHLLTNPAISCDPARLTSLSARLLEVDPLNEKAHRSLMSAYAMQRRHDAALRQFTRLRDLLEREHEEALRLAEEAISIRPQCANTNALYANILLWYGRPAEALDRVTFAIRAAPVYASWWVEILAAAYRDLSRLEMAEAAVLELLRRKPDSLEARVLLAGILAAQDRLDEAVMIGAQVNSLDPKCSPENLARRHPYRRNTDLEKLLSLLRSCGLPA
ncbi:BTAD domain-containing putative transcriptional regulator [Marimonas sp. MJW-29]|uniref:BTAD domain-containing putative transcriptional regulator n=1 Tax=Sulfitobacter sediminis TaxID=3234186 RepID=A0ABV3RVA5_9RHOB